MKKVLFLIIISLITVAIFRFLFFVPGEVCFKENCFSVEVADSEEERRRGLMFREKLDEEEGMLFIFEKEGNYPFWMKNMNFPLDIVWISKEREVVFIKKDFLPCENKNCKIITPKEKAKYVLELNSGTVDCFSIQEGEKVDFR
jgi:hypothetical protein